MFSRRGGLRLDRVQKERRTSFGSCSVGEEDFVWIVFSRRGGLLLDPGYQDGFWICNGITSTRCLPVFFDHRRVNVSIKLI